MAFEPGTALGHYEVTGLIGKGGMGEVYRARDITLGRDVAIKVLPSEFSRDEERLARLEREARMLAALNHPNIASIHGLEESGATRFLVLELVEGDTLADRLRRGAIGVEESLKLALQMAEALEAAHAKGVIHRDLKPANIKITPEGRLKVLDFGLAKAFIGDQADVDLSHSPTLSMAATQAGIILGTAAYMSPEQASGESADHRADLWAFGVVLFEMLTGRPLFTGKTAAHVMGAVLNIEPKWDALPANLHPRVRILLERLLEKEARDRLSGISDARVELQKVLSDPAGVVHAPVDAAGLRPQSSFRLVLALIAGVVIASVAWWGLNPGSPAQFRPVGRFVHSLGEGIAFTREGRPGIAVSPDGTKIVYVANQQLYLRNLSETDARPIPGTNEDPTTPFFSPDGEWVGFWSFTGLQLKKIAVTGGTPVPLTAASNPFGASWNADDTIVYAQPEGIFRVSADGGEAELLIATEAPELAHGPQLLPDGETILFSLTRTTGATRWDEADIVVETPGAENRKLVWNGGSDARYVHTGHVVYAWADSLFAFPFDPTGLERTGGQVPVVQSVQRALNPTTTTASANYGVSDTGTLVYRPGTSGAGARRNVLFVSPDGAATALPMEPRDYLIPRLSPDGSRIAFQVLDASGENHIWTMDYETGAATQLTFAGANQRPNWTPDGRDIIFNSDREGTISIWIQAADGSSAARLLVEGGGLWPTSVSPDGVLAYHNTSEGGRDIWTVDLEDGSPEEFLRTAYNERNPQFSPNGEWIAYVSNEGGPDDVYVRPFPRANGGLYRISEGGGHSPMWSSGGDTIYYFSSGNGALMAVPVEAGSGRLVPGTPRELFLNVFAAGNTEANASFYDVTPSGFLVASLPLTASNASPQIEIVTHWFEELEERAPVP